MRNDVFKFRQLDSFSYYEENLDKGISIRNKAVAVLELLQNT